MRVYDNNYPLLCNNLPPQDDPLEVKSATCNMTLSCSYLLVVCCALLCCAMLCRYRTYPRQSNRQSGNLKLRKLSTLELKRLNDSLLLDPPLN